MLKKADLGGTPGLSRRKEPGLGGGRGLSTRMTRTWRMPSIRKKKTSSTWIRSAPYWLLTGSNPYVAEPSRMCPIHKSSIIRTDPQCQSLVEIDTRFAFKTQRHSPPVALSNRCLQTDGPASRTRRASAADGNRRRRAETLDDLPPPRSSRRRTDTQPRPGLSGSQHGRPSKAYAWLQVDGLACVSE